MEIYIGNINDYTIEYLGGFVSAERIKISERYRFESDRKRTLLAHAMLGYAVSRSHPGISLPPEPVIDKYGKPHIYAPDELFFSLSHSEDYAICVIANRPVGADIEEIKNENKGIADRFFAKEEQMLVTDPLSFYRIWTLKESFIKALGAGMSLPMDSFGVCDLNEKTGTCRYQSCGAPIKNEAVELIRKSHTDEKSKYYKVSGMSLNVIPGYSMAYAVTDAEPDELTEYSITYPVL